MKIDKIVIHCLYTKGNQNPTVDEVRRWHVEDRGWSDIGYHFYCDRNAEGHPGRPLDEDNVLDPWERGAHVRGQNHNTIAIALAGGMSDDGKTQFNFTFAQIVWLRTTVAMLKVAHNVDTVVGHCDLDPKKPCPTFDVKYLLGDL